MAEDKGVGGGTAVGPLVAADLNRVVALDRALSGRARRGFFEARLAAALRDPHGFIQIGISDGDELAGYVFVRILEGEFGSENKIATLDSIGVDPARQGTGLGRSIMAALGNVMREKGVRELHSQVAWDNHALLRFLDLAGFRLAPRIVLGRTAIQSSPRYQGGSGDEGEDGTEILERDRIPIRSMVAGDLDSLVRIDRRITGHDRTSYFKPKVAEALEESGIRISVVAEDDGSVMGFIMARLDYGEFGQIEPEAVIDTIGVDPGFAHRRVGYALMSQLMVNLTALRVDSVRTELDWNRFDLIAFLEHCGFEPSQRLAFSLPLD